jgi:Uncharacterised protein family (UPF0158)
MAVIVSLHDVVTEMDLFSDEHTAYINRRTGELMTVTHEELALAEDPEAAEDAPQWQQELLPKVREVRESEDFLPLPSKFEIHEWALMERFARSVSDPTAGDELLDALHGRRAFRRFKDTLQRLELTEEWYRYREAALEEIAVEFLEANGIGYRRESKQQ